MKDTAYAAFMHDTENYAKLLFSVKGIKYDAKPAKTVIAQMLDGYCEAMDTNNDYDKNLFISGLIQRFRDKPKKLRDQSPNLNLDLMDFVGWLIKAIDLACEYRKWQKDPKVNAQQCVNQCIETIRVREYYQYNLDKNKANFNTYSLDNTYDENERTTILDTIPDTEEEMKVNRTSGYAFAQDLVQFYIDQKHIMEAVIFDVISTQDVMKVTKKVIQKIDADGNPYKYTKTTTEFWPFKCVQYLSQLPDSYYEYFLNSYRVVAEELQAVLTKIRNSSNSVLHKELNKTLEHAKAVMSRD